MGRFDIQRETLPARCEICHQSDSFDAARNHCARCAPLLSATDSPVPLTIPRELPMLRSIVFDMASLRANRRGSNSFLDQSRYRFFGWIPRLRTDLRRGDVKELAGFLLWLAITIFSIWKSLSTP
jgi:hypothetical protein